MRFHLGDILSITTGRLVSLKHVDGIYEILNFMTGDNLFTHQLGRAAAQCRPFLEQQFPQLGSLEVQEEMAHLNTLLEPIETNDERMRILNIWMANMVAIYGDTFEVSPIPLAQRHIRDAIEEAVEMVGPDRVIVIEADE